MVTNREQLLRQTSKVEAEVSELRRLVEEQLSLDGGALSEEATSATSGSIRPAAPAPNIGKRQKIKNQYRKKKHVRNDAGYVCGDRVYVIGVPKRKNERTGWKTRKQKEETRVLLGEVVHHTKAYVWVLLDDDYDGADPRQKANHHVRKEGDYDFLPAGLHPGPCPWAIPDSYSP